jgi:hypothetical protein
MAAVCAVIIEGKSRQTFTQVKQVPFRNGFEANDLKDDTQIDERSANDVVK